MDKKKHKKEYSVGYKKPPRHTQFEPGRSGNPKGRPKKVASLPDIFAKELRARVRMVRDGKRQNFTMLQVIVKQFLNQAATGDTKAAALVFNQLRENVPGARDQLSDLVQEFRAANARLVANNCPQQPASDSERKDKERS